MFHRILVLAVVFFVSSTALPAAEWSWEPRFTPGSAESLQAVYTQIHSSAASSDWLGVSVTDAVWEAPGFTLDIEEGSIFLEPPIDGRPGGAFFVGKASADFEPRGRSAANQTAYYFGQPALKGIPVTSAYLFTTDGMSILDEMGEGAEPSAPFDAPTEYEKVKRASRMLGFRLLTAVLDRDLSPEGCRFALLASPAVRDGSPDAFLLYGHDPGSRNDVYMEVFGHDDFFRLLGQRFGWTGLDDPHNRYFFHRLVADPGTSFRSRGTISAYDHSLTLAGVSDSDVETTMTLEVEPGVSVLPFDLSSRLEVVEVRTESGASLPFVQWTFLPERRRQPDETLLVHLGDDVPRGQPTQLTVVAKGPLFDAFFGTFQLADEDLWFPQLGDRLPAMHDLHLSTPKGHRALGPGQLVEEKVEGTRRLYHFRTSRPITFAGFYYGEFSAKEFKADDITVQLYSHQEADASAVKYAGTEIANALKVFSRILGPLEMKDLRAVGTPTGHGRGFDGLLLLSQYAVYRTDLSRIDFFRAHEVAHQWWGNVVDVKHWPEDRWIMESFAEYMAMEYYSLRFQKPAKTREQMQEQWIKPIFKTVDAKVENLTGDVSRRRMSELVSLAEGGNNVYSKGPLVLHMLRYLFQVQKKSDEGFWTLLQDFLEKYEYQQASTEDFIRLTEQHMQGRLGWFWDQWLYGTRIPTVKWSHEVTKAEGGGYVLTVNAEQEDTEFVLAIPIYVHTGGEALTTPLIMRGKNGQAKVRLRNKPSKVTLNDNFEALVEIKG